jgi:hypothetical protein
MDFAVKVGATLEYVRVTSSLVTQASEHGLQARNWAIVERVDDLTGDAGHFDSGGVKFYGSGMY